jgi:Tfp pilus assembly protein PilN
LRESQQGPSAVLHEIKARFDSVPELYLKSIEQKNSEITIKGLSPDESAVTRFGQSLEFSGGLFSNLNIETLRELAPAAPTSSTTTAAPVADSLIAKPEVVSFTVKCNYGGPRPQPSPATPSNQVALKK